MPKLRVLCLKEATQSILNDVYKLNELLAPMVGSLKSPEELCSLIEMSSHSFYALKNHQLAGYIVCFKEQSNYHSQNYRHFNGKFSKFCYIDRVGVPRDLENQGIGTELYNYVFNIDDFSNTRFCAEVNVKPMNEISLNFHRKLGFKETSKRLINNEHEVVYLEKYVR